MFTPQASDRIAPYREGSKSCFSAKIFLTVRRLDVFVLSPESSNSGLSLERSQRQPNSKNLRNLRNLRIVPPVVVVAPSPL
jgi:hypothetical protein